MLGRERASGAGQQGAGDSKERAIRNVERRSTPELDEFEAENVQKMESANRRIDEARKHMEDIAAALDVMDPEWKHGDNAFNRPSGKEMPAEAKVLFSRYNEAVAAFDEAMSLDMAVGEAAAKNVEFANKQREDMLTREEMRLTNRDALAAAGKDPDSF